jgi:hypothetical protein
VPEDVIPEQRRRLAVELFNRVWTLLRKENRTPEEDDEMVHAAHASRFHWGEIGTVANRARGEWQISRVYATLGRAEPALYHARRCLELCEAHPEQIEDWDLPVAHEALARAYGVGGDREEAARHAERARELGDLIEDEEDRRVLLQDLATL